MKPRLDADFINQGVDLLRHYHSPSCRDGDDILSTGLEIQALRDNHPLEFKAAERIYNNLYAGRKERRGRG